MVDLVSQYLFFFSCQNNPATLSRKKYQLKGFIWWLHSMGVFEISAVTSSHLTQFLNQPGRDGKPWTRLYRLQYSRLIIQFFGWLVDEGYLLVGPLDEIELKGKSETLPRTVPNVKTTNKFLDELLLQNMNPFRDRAILELAYGSGLRRIELYRLNMSDLQGDWLRVHGKGDRVRDIPLGSEARKWLRLYVSSERTKLTQGKPYELALFVSQRGTRLGIKSYSYLVSNKRPKEASWTLHSFRHACATHMMNNGASIRVLQKLLGHKKLSSTMIYTRVDTRDLKILLEKYHPRER